ncbi:MAG TPA: DUF669 domain-containing protein [Pirellulales bacterium]|nr:DUF669 domain-containing protein [Pirellulales bacterium]
MARKSLSDILRAGDRETLADAWGRTEAAGELEPLPAGEYVAAIERGELFTSKTKCTPAYKLTLRVVEGEHADRRLWCDVWLTPAALPVAKRDLSKLGITDLDQLERPLPEGIVCAVKVSLRKADDGAEYNRVKRFDVLRIDAPEGDPFAPVANGAGAPADAANDQAGAQDTGPAP